MCSIKKALSICIGDDENMSLSKKKILSKLSAIGTTITLFAIKANMVFAAETGGSGIGTAEVQTATENIKRVITSIAMPLRRSTYLCKCSSSSNKNDSKFK